MTQDKSTSWRVYENSSAIVASGDVTICVCMHSANAALIVQAVNSHDALRVCMEVLKEWNADSDGWNDVQLERRYPAGAIRRIKRTRAALAALGVETGSAIEAPREMAMKECVEALKPLANQLLNQTSDQIDPHAMYDLVLTANPDDGCCFIGAEIIRARSALAKLEKANG